MRIRRLKLSGFKSFVEPAELRIEPGLTGVVGPNGCGKSNLLEAIRWAMGESSPKSLRGGGMDDVIFAGTATRPPRDFAEVSILLERDCGRRRRPRRKRGHAADRARRRLGLPDRRPRRSRQGRLLAVRRRRDRRAFAGARQPGQDRRGHRRQAGRAPAAARGGGRHFRAPRPAQGRRAEAARDRSQSRPARRNPRRPGAARRAAAAAGARGRALPQADRPDPRRRGAAAPRPLGRGGARCRGGHVPKRRLRPKRSRAIQPAIAEAQAAQERANAALAERRRALDELREQGHELAHQLAAARARRDTVARRLAELDRLDASLAGDIAREEALQSDAGRAIAQLEKNASAIEQRLEDAEAHAARIAAELSAAEDGLARGRGGARRTACPPGGDARRAPGRGGGARGRARAARADRAGARRSSPSSSQRIGRRKRAGAARATKPRREPRRPPRPLPRRKRSGSRPNRAAPTAAEQRDAAESQLASARAALCRPRSRSTMRLRGRSNMAAARRSRA